MIDRNGIHKRLPPGTKVKFFWNPLGELSNHIWLCDETGETVLGMCPILKTAAWSSPDTIRAAMGQKIHQVTEMMAEVQARHLPETVQRRVAEKFNRFLLKSAQEAQRIPDLGKGDALTPSEILDATDCEDITPEPQQPTEAQQSSALNFLNQLA